MEICGQVFSRLSNLQSFTVTQVALTGMCDLMISLLIYCGNMIVVMIKTSLMRHQ